MPPFSVQDLLAQYRTSSLSIGPCCSYPPHCFRSIRLITFPTKGNWQQPSSLQLITDSLHAIRTILDHEHIARLYCPRPGCGRGQLEWPLVKETIARLIDDRFIFLTPPAPTRPRH